MRKPHVFAFAPNRWDGPWMNRQQILSRLARRGWSVTYSTGPLSLWERGSERWKGARWRTAYEMRDGVQVEVPGKMLPAWPRVASYDRLAIRHHAAALRRNAHRASREAIAYVFHPSLYGLAAALKCRWVFYHAYDIFELQPSWSDDLARAQDALLRRADLVVASSPTVARALHRAGRRDVLVLPNGAHAQAFERGPLQPCPSDLAAIPQPRIGYIGGVNRKVDFPMIAAVAQRQPGWHWALVGPLPTDGSGAPDSDPRIAAAFRECLALPNVHFLGLKPHTELPAYAGHMDVNAICYRPDPGWWNAATPLKLHEYLATGRPVVSVDLPDIKAFADSITFVRGADEWVRGIEAALAGRAPQTVEHRRRIARANSWDRRVDLLEQHFYAAVGADAAPPTPALKGCG